MVQKIIILLVGLLLGHSVQSQQPCATIPPDKDVLDMFKYRSKKMNRLEDDEVKRMGIYVTVLGTESDQARMTDILIQREINDINYFFRGQGAVPSEHQHLVADIKFEFYHAGTLGS